MVLIAFILMGVVAFILLILVYSGLRVVQQYERGVVFRLGRLQGAKGPGLFWIWPVISQMRRIDLRIITLEVAPQEVITRDNVTLKVTAVVYFYVVDPAQAVVQVLDYVRATSQMVQTTLRNVLGQSELDDLLAQRDLINTEPLSRFQTGGSGGNHRRLCRTLALRCRLVTAFRPSALAGRPVAGDAL